MANHELRKILDDCLPKAFQVDLVRGLFQAYREVFEECRVYPEFLDRDAMGQLRRIKFDTIMKSVADRYGLTARIAPNKSHNCFHTRVQAGRVILTASCVPTPNAMVRDAEFRKTYARDAQLTLEGFERDESDPEDSVYVILLHGVNREAKTEEELATPAFAGMAFPDRSLTKYVDTIDLFARFWNTIHYGIDAENATQEFGISLRKDKRGKKREQQ